MASATLEVAAPPTILFDMIVDGNRDVYRVALDGLELERLTADPAEDSDPAAAAGGPVVFVSRRDGNAELYGMAAGSNVATRLTNTQGSEAQPELSADGQHLAYTRDDAGMPRVWTSAPSAADALQLTRGFGSTGSIEASPALSPRGDSVVFTATAHGTANLYVDGAGASAPVPLLPASPDSVRVEAAWSIDGKQVAFVAAARTASQLFLLALTGSTRTQLTDGARSVGQPAWLQDGRLLFTRFADTHTELCWLDLDSPDTIHVIPLPGEDPQHPHGDV